MLTGVIASYDVARRFGFVVLDDDARHAFFHAEDVRGLAPHDSLHVGDRVRVERISRAPKGPRAHIVRRLVDPEPTP